MARWKDYSEPGRHLNALCVIARQPRQVYVQDSMDKAGGFVSIFRDKETSMEDTVIGRRCGSVLCESAARPRTSPSTQKSR
jgi:hypothetical protein